MKREKVEVPKAVVVNTSGLRPLGHALLVRTYEVQSSIIAIPDSIRERGVLAEQRAVVVAVGEGFLGFWSRLSRFLGLSVELRAKPGDKVIFTKYAGYVAQGPADGVIYRVLNNRDVFLQITEEAKEEENG